jgi:hypothetical protein
LANEANEQRRHELAEHATTLATKALAEDGHNKEDDDVAWQFDAYAAPLFARVDAVMAKIQAMDDGFGNIAAFGDEILAEEDDEASAPMMPPLAPPTAVSPTPHRPTSYVGAAVLNIEGGAHATPLVVAPLPQPSAEPQSSAANGKPRTVRCRARPRRCTSRRNRPQAPSPPAKAATASSTTRPGTPSTVPPEAARASSSTRSGTPSHVPPLTARASSPTRSRTPSTVPPEAARASSSTCSGTPSHVPPSTARASSPTHSRTSSTVPPLTTSFTPSSHPVKGDAHQFCDGDPPLPPWKHSRRKHRPRRVCRRHGPWAPDPQEHLLRGRRHRPRAPKKSTVNGWA